MIYSCVGEYYDYMYYHLKPIHLYELYWNCIYIIIYPSIHVNVTNIVHLCIKELISRKIFLQNGVSL